jgi:hypothetical protein
LQCQQIACINYKDYCNIRFRGKIMQFNVVDKKEKRMQINVVDKKGKR